MAAIALSKVRRGISKKMPQTKDELLAFLQSEFVDSYRQCRDAANTLVDAVNDSLGLSLGKIDRGLSKKMPQDDAELLGFAKFELLPSYQQCRFVVNTTVDALNLHFGLTLGKVKRAVSKKEVSTSDELLDLAQNELIGSYRQCRDVVNAAVDAATPLL